MKDFQSADGNCSSRILPSCGPEARPHKLCRQRRRVQAGARDYRDGFNAVIMDNHEVSGLGRGRRTSRAGVLQAEFESDGTERDTRPDSTGGVPTVNVMERVDTVTFEDAFAALPDWRAAVVAVVKVASIEWFGG